MIPFTPLTSASGTLVQSPAIFIKFQYPLPHRFAYEFLLSGASILCVQILTCIKCKTEHLTVRIFGNKSVLLTFFLCSARYVLMKRVASLSPASSYAGIFFYKTRLYIKY